MTALPSSIAVFTSFSGQGGVERMVMNLVHEFARQGVKVDLLALKGNSHLLDQLPAEVTLHRLKAKHSSTVVGELARYMKEHQPEAMLVAKDRPGRAALKARRKAGVKTRIVIRLGTTLSAALAHKNGFQRWLRQWPLQRGYRGVDAVVPVSQGVADDTVAVTGLPARLMRVIRNPVITPEMTTLAQETVEHPWFSDPYLPVVLGAGRLTIQKDFVCLIRAFAEVREQIPSRLVILGDGALKDELTALAHELGVADFVDFAGFQPNPYKFMKAADLFVLSSRWEGSPNVLTEAIAQGTPVVSTDCPSGPIELLQRGRYGPLVPVGDHHALAAAMTATLLNPLDGDTLKQAASEYNAETSARRYLELLFPKSSEVKS